MTPTFFPGPPSRPFRHCVAPCEAAERGVARGSGGSKQGGVGEKVESSAVSKWNNAMQRCLVCMSVMRLHLVCRKRCVSAGPGLTQALPLQRIQSAHAPFIPRPTPPLSPRSASSPVQPHVRRTDAPHRQPVAQHAPEHARRVVHRRPPRLRAPRPHRQPLRSCSLPCPPCALAASCTRRSAAGKEGLQRARGMSRGTEVRRGRCHVGTEEDAEWGPEGGSEGWRVRTVGCLAKAGRRKRGIGRKVGSVIPTLPQVQWVWNQRLGHARGEREGQRT